MLKGSDQLSYNAARMRKTNRDAEGEDEYSGITCQDLLVGQRSPLEAKSIGQNAVGDFRHGRKRLSGTESGRGIAVDGRCRVKIVALDAGGPCARFDRKNGTQRDRSPSGTASAKLSNILGILTKAPRQPER